MTLSTKQFVNPYAFVPLAPAGSRAQPTFHGGHRPGDVFSGRLTVRWRFQTPLLLPANAREEGWVEGPAIRIPGSSIAGAVRSLHEALFNGCFRVVDEVFVPGYREPADSDPGLTLALVTKSEGGVPREVRLCDDPVWVDSADLLSRWPANQPVPTTGDVVRFSGEIEDLDGLERAQFATLTKVAVVRRAEQHAPSPDSDADARVLLVTATSVRRKRKRNGEPGRALWVAGKLTKRLVTLDPERDAAVLADFRAAAEGTDDRRRLVKDDPDGAWRTQTQYDPVEWWDASGRRFRVVGRRAKASGLLFIGDPVWVRYDPASQRITLMKLASIWRRAGKRSVGERLPAHLKPCDPGANEGLCLSCATFGAADTTTAESNRQVSYAGHVRFGAARGQAKRLEQVDLAPMGAPRPGNGMFYLDRYQLPARVPHEGSGEDLVATHWGSWAEGERQRIAGRKFFWHSDPDRQARLMSGVLGRGVPPRYRATDRQKTAKMSRPAQLARFESDLVSTVSFDQLDAVALHALLGALEPQRVLSVAPGRQDARFATHLGGGKPFGLGSVVASIDWSASRVSTLAGRYGDGDAAPVALDGPFPFKDVTDRVGDIAPNLLSLATMLDLDALGERAALVSYPPGDTWDGYRHSDRAREDAFAESFHFFGEANGEVLKRGTRPWHPLPRPGETPTLPIYPARRR